MAYDKKMGGKMMDSGKGVYSYSKNPMSKANQVSPMCGPGGNADQQKANKLLQKAHKENDSLRGEAGM